MFRDGISTAASLKGRKNPRKHRPSDFKVMSFKSLCELLDHIGVANSKSYLAHIRDPWAFMLLCGLPSPVSLPAFRPVDDRADWSCEDVYRGLVGGDSDELDFILSRMDKRELEYLHIFASGEVPRGVSVYDLLAGLASVRFFDVGDAYASWRLQPDPASLAFAVLSNYTSPGGYAGGYQRVSPAAGQPVILPNVQRRMGVVRFPVLVESFDRDMRRLQVHRSGEDVRIFDYKGSSVVDDAVADFARKTPNDFVIDVLRGDGSVRLLDIVSLNDIWFHNRPLSERLSYFWRFFDGVERLVLWSFPELRERRSLFGESDVLVRNLNEDFVDNFWMVLGLSGVAQLEVARRRGSRTFGLRSEDRDVVFEFQEHWQDRISGAETGKIVDVSYDGTILGHRKDLKKPMSSEELLNAWGLKSIDDILVDGYPRAIPWKKISSDNELKRYRKDKYNRQIEEKKKKEDKLEGILFE